MGFAEATTQQDGKANRVEAHKSEDGLATTQFRLRRGASFIDDELALANAGKHMLESLGYDVVMRTSSIEALELIKSRPDRFDLVITDMTMPGLTGDNLAQKLMEIRSDLPVILCTGFSARMNEKKALALGIRSFVTKPVLKRQIAETIRKVLDQDKI